MFRDAVSGVVCPRNTISVSDFDVLGNKISLSDIVGLKILKLLAQQNVTY